MRRVREFRLAKISKGIIPNDGNMKNVSQKIIDNVANITNEQKKQVSNCPTRVYSSLPTRGQNWRRTGMLHFHFVHL